MITTKTLVVALASLAVLTAAGVGGYVATRTDSATQPVEAASAALVTPAVPAASPSTTVEVQPEAPKPADVRQPEPAVRQPESRDTARREPARVPASRPRDTRPATSESPAPSAPVSHPPAPLPVPAPSAVSAETIPPATVPEAPPPVREPEKPKFEEVIVKSDSVIGIRLDSAISSETARVEDRVTARVSRDVTVNERVAIPAGARLEGNVTLVERGGKFKERARLGIRFTTLVLADGTTRLPIETETIFRDGDSPATEATSKIGASVVVGAILGGIVGGKKGAAIGSAAGAGGGTAAVMASGRNAATLPAGTPLTVRLTSPVTVLVEREQ